jgi:hypothetical protein
MVARHRSRVHLCLVILYAFCRRRNPTENERLVTGMLVVDVLMSEANVFAQWHREAVYVAGFALAAALIFAGLFWTLARQLRRQAVQNGELEVAAIRLTKKQQMLGAYAEMSADRFWEQDADFRFKFDSKFPFMTEADDSGKTRWELADPAMHQERWDVHKAELVANFLFATSAGSGSGIRSGLLASRIRHRLLIRPGAGFGKWFSRSLKPGLFQFERGLGQYAAL